MVSRRRRWICLRLKQLVLGGDYSCGLTTGGEVFCWGNNDFGQLSLPDDLGPVAQLAAAALHACALTVAGEVRCWGLDFMGELAVPPMTPGGVTAIAAGGGSSCALVVDGSVRCWGNGLGGSVPADLRPGDAVLWLSPKRLHPGQRALIRFDDLRTTPERFDARIQLFGDGLEPDVHYRVLDSAGNVLGTEQDGSYLLTGNPFPTAFIEALIGALESPLRLHVLPLELSASSDSTPSVRAVTQIIELAMPASSTLSLLRVSVPSGAVQTVATRGSDTATIGIRVAAFNFEMQAVSAFDLELVATLVGGSAVSWSPTSSTPGSLVRTTELGVFEGLLRVNLGANDPAAAFRIGVRVPGAPGEVVVETTVVDVVRVVGFTATTATLTEGMDAVELRIGLPLHPIGSRIEIDLAVSGTAMMGVDYTLLAASTQPGIMLASDSTAVITLLLEATVADDIRLLLRPRADDFISQGIHSLNLSIVRYVVHSTENVSFALPPALDFAIIDDDLSRVERLLAVDADAVCAIVSGGQVRCWYGSSASSQVAALHCGV